MRKPAAFLPIVNPHAAGIDIGSAHLPNHRFFKAFFIQKGKIVQDYWWFVFDMETGEKTIDFTKSEYSLKVHRSNFGNDFTVNIQFYQDYMNVLIKPEWLFRL